MASGARAQTYPTRPIRLIVGFPASNASDIVARLIAQKLSDRLGQPFVVENRPGAGGNIGAEVVVNAQADGYTLLLISPSSTTNATLYDNLNFNFIRDIAPVAGVARGPYVMVLHPSFPAQSVAEFLAYAKANPGKINMASSGNGSLSHMCGAYFMMLTGVNMLHVPYRNSFMPDLFAGQVQVAFGPIPQVIAGLQTGKLRALAVTTATRSPALPDIPALAETIPGYDASGWYGIGAPKNVSGEIVTRLNTAVGTDLGDAKVVERLADLGAVPTPMTPAEFSQFIATETEKWAKVIHAGNIKVD
ncbi:MAG TPA: tripartite tricarboxylate transporter substrate binding protein [Xanthobacteraceae bacterium]|nr:tripartite tricarboxylate transporter substrate binding protein [Xanthobacteraceae bacterium]